MGNFERRTFERQELCPWCMKKGIEVVALKKAVKRICLNRCGYYAWEPKSLLVGRELGRWYGKKKRRRP